MKHDYKVIYTEYCDIWEFCIYDGDELVKEGWTAAVSIDLYNCDSVENYILKWCMQEGR